MMRATFFLLCATALVGKSLSDDQNVVTMKGPVMAHPFNCKITSTQPLMRVISVQGIHPTFSLECNRLILQFHNFFFTVASAAVTALSNSATMITHIICRSDGKLSRTSTRRLADTPNLRHATPPRTLEDQPEGDMVPSSSGTSQPTYLLADREDDDATKVAQQEEEPTADPTMQPTDPVEIIAKAAGDEADADDDEKLGKVEGPTPSPTPSPSAEEVPSEMPSPIPEGPTPSPTSVPSVTIEQKAVTNSPTPEAPTPAPTEKPTNAGPTPSPSFSPTAAEVTPMPTESPTPGGPTPSPTEKPSKSNSDGVPPPIGDFEDDEYSIGYDPTEAPSESSEPTDPLLCPTECPTSCVVPTD